MEGGTVTVDTNTEDAFARVVIEISEGIATQFSYLYGFEWDEVKSVCIEAAYERKQYVEVGARENIGLITLYLQRAAKAHFHNQRVKALAESDDYVYDPEYVRLFLPYWFARDDWMNGPINEDSIAEYPSTEALDTAIDIREAWERLKPWQVSLIVARHVTCPPTLDAGVDWDAIAAIVGRKTGESARVGYTDATRQLAYAMNINRANRDADYDGPGSRVAISNATAAVIVHNN